MKIQFTHFSYVLETYSFGTEKWNSIPDIHIQIDHGDKQPFWRKGQSMKLHLSITSGPHTSTYIWGSSVSRMFRIWTGRPSHRDLFFGRTRYVSLTRIVQTDYGSHPASCSDGTKGSLPGRKRPGREYYQSYPSSEEIKKARNCIVTEEHSLMSWYLNKNRDSGWPWMVNHVGQIYWPSYLWHNCSSGMY